MLAWSKGKGSQEGTVTRPTETQTRWVACRRNAGLAEYRLGTPLVFLFKFSPFSRSHLTTCQTALPSSTNSRPGQRTSVTMYSQVTNTLACHTSRQRGGAAWVSAHPCALEAGKVATCCCGCPVSIFLLFTPTRNTYFPRLVCS